jgi:hypothetical protein
MLFIAFVFVPIAGLGYCALSVSMYSTSSQEKNRELMCEECFKSVAFASEMLGCNKNILEEQGYYN